MPVRQYITTGPIELILQERETGKQAALELSAEEGPRYDFLIAVLTFDQFSIKKYYAFIPKYIIKRKIIDYSKANLALEGDLEILAKDFPDLEIKGREKRFGKSLIHA